MLEGMTPPVREALCPLMRNAATLDKKDLAILIEALEDPRWTAKELTAALAERGFHTTVNQINKHNAKACSCAR